MLLRLLTSSLSSCSSSSYLSFKYLSPYISCLSFSTSSSSDSLRWIEPKGKEWKPTGISIYNSLTDNKVPLLINSNKGYLTWYSCGPTVYDHAHIGHARTYVCFDIIKRILTNYFRLPIYTVLGMTDIDDKIINKAISISSPSSSLTIGDISKVSTKFETSFLTDMSSLNVSSPNIITRVSEHIPEVIDFIQQIESSSSSYSSPSGVYFDTAAFGPYGKLAPSRQRDLDIDASLTSSSSSNNNNSNNNTNHPSNQDKKNVKDFALWKVVDSNSQKIDSFVSWSSPWGPGRPGWHIECSTMASTYLGQNIDIHTGGIDLAFPHHENELAQSEAAHGCSQWVNYFMHSGHVHIEGRKMSKSLKNFITISDFLADHEPDVFRLYCLLHSYRSPIHFSDAALAEPISLLNTFRQFFFNVQTYLDSYPTSHSSFSLKPTEPSLQLQSSFLAHQTSIHASLSDDFNTQAVVKSSLSLTKKLSPLLLDGSFTLPPQLVASISEHFKELFTMFGLQSFSSSSSSSNSNDSNDSNSDHTQLLIDHILKLRQDARTLAKSSLKDPSSKPQAIQVLNTCDSIRKLFSDQLELELEDRQQGTIIKNKKQ